MNRKEITKSISKRTNLSHVKSREILDFITETIQKTLKRGERIRLRGFGTFAVKKRKSKMVLGFDGNPIRIPARNVAKFSASENLIKSLNKSDTKNTSKNTTKNTTKNTSKNTSKKNTRK